MPPTKKSALTAKEAEALLQLFGSALAALDKASLEGDPHALSVLIRDVPPVRPAVEKLISIAPARARVATGWDSPGKSARLGDIVRRCEDIAARVAAGASDKVAVAVRADLGIRDKDEE